MTQQTLNELITANQIAMANFEKFTAELENAIDTCDKIYANLIRQGYDKSEVFDYTRRLFNLIG